MLLDTIYTTVHTSSLYNASAYCITRSNRVLELTLLNKVIVNIKALAMPQEQVFELCQTGDFKNVNVIPKDARLESVNSAIVEKFFPLASDRLFDPAYLSISYVVRMLDILEYITKNKTVQQIGPAFNAMTSLLGQKCPGLSLNKDALLQRIDSFEKTVGVPLPALQKRPLPAESHQLLSWALARSVSNDPIMQAFIRYYVFWGEVSPAFSKVLVRKNKNVDQHPGIANIVPQKDFAEWQEVNLYKGLNKIGRLRLSEEKKTSYIAPEARLASSGQDRSSGRAELMVSTGDLQRMGLRDGENIVCLFE